jgi:hypothetical protein
MNRNFRHVPRTLGALTFAATVALATLGIAGAPAGTERSARPMIGDFTGELGPAGPVYRLPSVHVVADRSVELARIEREEHSATRAHHRASVPVLPFLVREVA